MTGRFDLRSARLNKGLSLRQAGERIGVAPNTIKRLEDGQNGIHPATAKKIADYFDVPVTALIEIDERRAA